MHRHIYVHTDISYMNAYTCVSMYANIHAHRYAWVYMCMNVYKYTYFRYTYVCIHVCMNPYMCIDYMNIYI